MDFSGTPTYHAGHPKDQPQIVDVIEDESTITLVCKSTDNQHFLVDSIVNINDSEQKPTRLVVYQEDPNNKCVFLIENNGDIAIQIHGQDTCYKIGTIQTLRLVTSNGIALFDDSFYTHAIITLTELKIEEKTIIVAFSKEYRLTNAIGRAFSALLILDEIWVRINRLLDLIVKVDIANKLLESVWIQSVEDKGNLSLSPQDPASFFRQQMKIKDWTHAESSVVNFKRLATTNAGLDGDFNNPL